MRVACALVLVAGTAHADDALHAHVTAEQDTHYLEIDPTSKKADTIRSKLEENK